ncbi:MAG: AAA family ATPase [Spirochaetaceae bacterium]|jgi:MoxR-like ATPase|nr:AAA family ATPase [Spirochaetaceae bacterium]
MDNNTGDALIAGAERVIQGKRAFLELLAAAILARGHVLIEDNPGLGKTTAAKAFAQLIAGENGAPVSFKRIQFTPDLLPYDITGVDVWDPETRSFRFMPGPILSSIVLADEINRTTPKVQSALLEVMAEGQVTIGHTSHRPPAPFFVIATENPIESEGTFPLPAAQLDRFLMRLSIGYPDRETELALLDEPSPGYHLQTLAPVTGVAALLEAQSVCDALYCHPALKAVIAGTVRATRAHPAFSLGASPRASLHFLAAARAFAYVKGRDFVSAEDVAETAVPVLAHRIRLKESGADKGKAAAIIREICGTETSKAEAAKTGG